MDEAHFWVRNPQNEQFFEGILLLCPKQLCLNLRQGVFRIKCLFGGDFWNSVLNENMPGSHKAKLNGLKRLSI